jgi:hypothetical protein
MFIKTKQRGGRTAFYLCIAESGGGNGYSWKSVEYSVCLGETLDLSSAQWVDTLRRSPYFRSASLEDVLEVVEEYVAKHGFRSEILDGLREAVRGRKEKSRKSVRSERRSQEDEREKALRLLGLPPGSSEDEIVSAFRKAARRHHPDIGGDPARFRAILKARNLLLGREAGWGESA